MKDVFVHFLEPFQHSQKLAFADLGALDQRRSLGEFLVFDILSSQERVELL